MDQQISPIGVRIVIQRYSFIYRFDLVIPNRLLASAYPGEKNPVSHQKLTYDIIATGVQVIVNLMEEQELTTFTPYKEIMQEHVKACI